MRQPTSDRIDREEAVSHLIEYGIISAILVILIVITMPVVSNILIEQPTRVLTYYSFIDVANGVSTRIVDIYAIPSDYSSVDIISKFDIPDMVAGREYYVDISGENQTQMVTVSRGDQYAVVSLSGIGSTRRVSGNTTGSGVNQISYIYP